MCHVGATRLLDKRSARDLDRRLYHECPAIYRAITLCGKGDHRAADEAFHRAPDQAFHRADLVSNPSLLEIEV